MMDEFLYEISLRGDPIFLSEDREEAFYALEDYSRDQLENIPDLSFSIYKGVDSVLDLSADEILDYLDNG